MKRIGFITIGQSPRRDLVPYLLERLPAGTAPFESGALDGLSPDEIAALDSPDAGLHLVTKLRDGTPVRLALERVRPVMQERVTALRRHDVDLNVILCGADWSDLHSDVPMINPGVLFPSVISALTGKSRLGIIRPSATQIPATEEEYRMRLGLDALVTSASPYEGEPVENARRAARDLRQFKPALVWMTCVGMQEDMRQTVQEELGVPVILARSLLARMIAELAV